MSFTNGLMSTGLGLRCRWNGACEARFQSDGTVEGIRDSAKMRDEHEVAQHGYHHQIVELTQWSYTARFSRNGLSVLNRKKK